MTLLAIYLATLAVLIVMVLIVIVRLQDALDKLHVSVTKVAVNADMMVDRLIALRSDMQAVECELAGIRDNLENSQDV